MSTRSLGSIAGPLATALQQQLAQTPNRNGIFARPLGGLNAFAGAIGSYCRSDDTVCQRGASGTGHFRYSADRSAAVAFVRGELG